MDVTLGIQIFLIKYGDTNIDITKRNPRANSDTKI